MPIIKSAKKRVRQTAKATARNAHVKKNLRGAVKSLQIAIASGNKQKVKQAHSRVDGALDVATKKRVFHKNKSARKKRQIAKLVKASANQKTTSKKVTPAKPAAKRTPAKTTAKAKSTAPKKKTAKKTTAKKAK